MDGYMPKCDRCEHYNSCEVQRRLTQLSQELWNISREKCGRTDGFVDGKYVKDATEPQTEQTEPTIKVSEEIPKDIVEPIGNGNVIMSEETYNELIEQSVVSEDTISRARVLEYLTDAQFFLRYVDDVQLTVSEPPTIKPYDVCEWLIEGIKNIPSVVADRPQGEE